MPNLPLTPTQLAIYYESMANPGQSVYLISVLLHLDPAVDIQRLQMAVADAVNAHPALRMRISVGEDGMPSLEDPGEYSPAECPVVTGSDAEIDETVDCLPDCAARPEGSRLFDARIFSSPSGNSLYLSVSHIVSDGSSMSILFDAIKDAYDGKTPDNADRVGQVFRSVEEKRNSALAAEAKAWYEKEFSGIENDSFPEPDILEVSPTVPTSRELYHTRLSTSFADAFARSRELGVPLSVLLDGTFGYMLSVWNGAEDVLFATVFANRDNPTFKNTVCMMVETLAVYCRPQTSPEATVADYFLPLKQQRENARRFAETISFAEVCGITGIAPKVNFSYRGSVQTEKVAFPGLITSSRHLSTYSTSDTLQCLVDHVDDGLELRIEYNPAKYTRQYIESLADCYDTVLSGMLTCKRLADVQICSTKAKGILEAFNQTNDVRPSDETIVDLFRRHAAARPDAVLLVDDFHLTYRQVAETAEHLAVHLSSMGIGKGDVVAIMPKRNAHMLTATLGVLASGAAYQPLDHTYPAERLNFMMRDADVKMLISDPGLDLDLEDDLKGKVTVMHTDALDTLPPVPDGYTAARPSLDDTFILLYTSGTTGTPKGVSLTHGNLMALWNTCRREYPDYTSPEDIWAMYASYGFDAGFFSMLIPVCAGGGVYIVPEDIRLDMEALNDAFRRNGVTFAFMTTQVGRIFATTIEKTSLKALMVGGEKLVPCDPSVDFSLYNLYGPTEGTVFCNAKLVDRLYTRVPIGRHLVDYRDYIIDRHGRRLPAGAVGEMLIAGPQVGKGYLNLPERTAKSFTPNPFDSTPGYGVTYHTGDMVRLLPATGEADIIGRNDGQVKIRGFRIELAEVEGIVRQFPGITDATVQAFDAPSGGKFIAAYVVSPSEVDIDALHSFIAESKPYYMVPEVTMQIDAIPLNQNQKVNRRALPAPTLTAKIESAEPSRRPNILEAAIAEIVGSTLGMDEVPLTVELSRLGLTSISSIRLAAALFKRFGVTFKGAELVKGATVCSIEDRVLQLLLAPRTPQKDTTAAKESSARTSAPLTVSQQGVYADTMRNPGTTSYNIPIYFRFRPTVAPEAVADAMHRILDAHPYLRDARLTIGEEDVEQCVVPEVAADVPVKQMSEVEFEEYKRHYIRPFDLMRAPLYRIEVVKTPEAVYLLLDIQHIVFDGSSLTLLISQLKTLLEGGEIMDEEYSYLAYADAERYWLEGEEGKRAAEYFRGMLSHCESASDIPSDINGAQDAGECGIATAAFDMETVETFCRQSELTPAALFLAATGYAVARFTTSRDAFISTISTGRSDVRFADTFGMFVKTLPIGLKIGEGNALQFAIRAKEALEGAVANEMYPYARICAEYNYAPNIVYEYQLGLVDTLMVNGEEVERRLFDVDTLKFKIAVRIEEVDGKPCVALHYRKGLYSERLMRSLCDGITRVALSIVQCPESPARKLSMLSEEQKATLDCYATSKVDEPSGKCFHELMEEQARLHPDRTAVKACDASLTYAELNRRADVVASRLMERGVKPGDRVVLLLSRTSRFFTSLYGVLKAGAAYIPSSPDYPEERRKAIIEDSGAAFVITDENVSELHQGEPAQDLKKSLARPDDIAYMIYTSGSTGKPKGVILRHRGIVNYVTPDKSNIHTHAIVNNCKVVGSVTTVAFDMALKEWGIGLSNGLTVVFADDNQTNDPIALSAAFKDAGVDYFNTTPSRMQQYMELDDFRNMLHGCKVVICGAEKYPDKLLPLLRLAAPEARIFNTYGPTEITVSCNAAELTHTSHVSVGRPLHNYVEHIVDIDDNILPPGATGELLIGGTNIAAGYNANPEQTAKAFFDFCGIPTYRSGDYARWDGEGNVVILGRKDTQVKLRGLRIELGEIERVIGAVDGIAMSHVMIRNIGGRENLVAWYSLKPGVTLSPEALKEIAAKKLTEYMVPSFFVEMQSMPLTPNGKINAKALPDPEIAEREEGRAATNKTEEFFIDVFKGILSLDKVYADDNFFSLGGTSLTATRVLIAASKAGHKLIYADIFAHPTPEGLARIVSSAPEEEPQDKAGDIYSQNPAEYDYSAIESVLQRNTLEGFRTGSRREIGCVMLAGATGFAGIHVLHELLENTGSNVVCLGRDSRNGVPAAERLSHLFFYYFGESLEDKYPGRVVTVAGDITSITSDFDPGCRVDTLINCAANVKHFSAGTDIEDVNYYAVLRLIDWCKAHDTALVQTSTISVAGQQAADRNGRLTEQTLWMEQDFSANKYIISKFMAERAVLQAVADGVIKGKVVRLGNLAPREIDGEFQINFRTNGFMNRLKSVALVGCYPYAMYTQHKDVSPIDDVAKAIVMFAQTPDCCVLFHGNNANRYSLGNFYADAARTGLDIHPVETEEYSAALEEAKNDPEKLGALVGLMAYEGMGNGLKPVDYTNDFSSQVLLRMGFQWPVISREYVSKLVKALSTLSFFEI